MVTQEQLGLDIGRQISDGEVWKVGRLGLQVVALAMVAAEVGAMDFHSGAGARLRLAVADRATDVATKVRDPVRLGRPHAKTPSGPTGCSVGVAPS